VGSGNVIEMASYDVLGMAQPQNRADGGAEIASLRTKALVAQLVHQHRPKIGDAKGVHATPGGPVRKAKARKRRNYHVEGDRGVAAVSGRIGEQGNDLEHFQKRPGPTMG